MSLTARLARLLLPHWRWLAVAVALGVVGVGSNIALVATSAYLISRAAVASGVAEIALIITAVRVLAITRAGALYLERLTSHRVAFDLLSDLRVWFFGAIEPLAPAGFMHRRSGDVLTRAVRDVDAMRDLSVVVFLPPLVAAIAVTVMTVIFGAVDPALAIVLVAYVALTLVVLPLITRWLGRQDAELEAEQRGEVAALALDATSGIAELVALDQAEAQRSRLLDLAERLDRRRERTATVEGISDALALLLASLLGLTVLGLAVGLVSGGRVEGVFLAALPLAAIATFETLPPVLRSLRTLDTSRASAARLFELIDQPPLVRDPSTPAPLPTGDAVEFDEVAFRYGTDEAPVFDGLSLRVEPGEHVAIVGPSGAGKSTLIDLLSRFWEIDGGVIRLGGSDIRTLAADDVRARLGIVPQTIDLFDTTLRENLALADADVTDERLGEACRIAQLDDWIATLPAGYDTPMGEDGTLVSGGERRRIGIARLIIRDAPIAVLDEPTADIDAATAGRMWTAMTPFLAQRTVILLAHRALPGAPVDRTIGVRPTDTKV